MEAGWPVSATQRSGSVNVETGIGTMRTWAPGDSRRPVTAVLQPAGTAATVAAGNGAGTRGSTAITDRPAISRPAPGQLARAASKPNASAAAAAPSATIENRSGSTEPV